MESVDHGQGIKRHATPRHRLWCVVTAALLGGCGPTDTISESEVAALVVPNFVNTKSDNKDSFADLGPILAYGQTLTHEFRIANQSASPLKILGAEPLMPCCSAIRERPGTVAPGESSDLVIEFRPGFQSGRKRVEFVVATNDPIHPSRQFGLTANLIGEIEVVSSQKAAVSLPVHASGELAFRLICRRVNGEGRGLPSVITSGSSKARFTSPGSDLERNGVIESIRDFLVELAPEQEPGSRRDEVRFTWPDGRSWDHQIGWTVRAAIGATPSAVVIHRGKAVRRSILLESEDRPFSVLAVRGNLVVRTHPKLPTEDSNRLMITLEIDPNRAGESGMVEIVTNHPDGRSLPVTIHIAPKAEVGR